VPLPLDESEPIGINRYQVTVVASSAEDVVRSAGGWLCDRARAGWDVNVLVADRRGAQPFAILGANPVEDEAGLSSVVSKASRSGALAISADLLATDERVRGDVLTVLKRGLAEVTVWGQEWPAELGRKVSPVEHRLSSAARAFKARALDASPDSVATTETLFHLGADNFRPLYSV
jgi:hypothetical protein